jgi:hypothetical protein
MAKAKKSEKVNVTEAEATVEATSEQSEVVESGPSLTELMDKMKKEGKSYIRVKKLF